MVSKFWVFQERSHKFNVLFVNTLSETRIEFSQVTVFST